jgi:hypothetical protein
MTRICVQREEEVRPGPFVAWDFPGVAVVVGVPTPCERRLLAEQDRKAVAGFVEQRMTRLADRLFSGLARHQTCRWLARGTTDRRIRCHHIAHRPTPARSDVRAALQQGQLRVLVLTGPR